jgi:hypothetical protein
VRTTFRKQLIWEVLRERKAVILDELRWTVFEREAGRLNRKLEAITQSQMTSFSRTVREHMPELSLWDVDFREPSQYPASVIAATAVYRLREWAKLRAFLDSDSPTVEWRYVKDLPVAEFGETPRYIAGGGFAQPQYHLHLCDLYANYKDRPREHVSRVRIPPSHKATIVQLAGPDQVDFQSLSTNWHWKVVAID